MSKLNVTIAVRNDIQGNLAITKQRISDYFFEDKSHLTDDRMRNNFASSSGTIFGLHHCRFTIRHRRDLNSFPCCCRVSFIA